MTATKSLKKLPIDTTIYTDASFDGWEAVCEKSETGSMCTKQEQALHINTIEILRDKLGLLSFFKDNKDIKHIRIMMDNNTAVAYTNNMGELDPISVTILLLTYDNGLQNDKYRFQQPTSQDLKVLEWKLMDDKFEQIVSTFGKPDIDLFASRINHHLSNYVSWRPDPGAKTVEAFSINW